MANVRLFRAQTINTQVWTNRNFVGFLYSYDLVRKKMARDENVGILMKKKKKMNTASKAMWSTIFTKAYLNHNYANFTII